ncbi:NUDIX hydrolase [Methylobacterium sp. Leaf111]|uniref:NUDIX hydrolase n=1 Tax=Methylobacterium sp. Leaf111 TaxID=1736257 RepID=UPI00138F38AB|nr:NUDIX domain-containing protein [Methylobacterium sp. Leaf111]
MTFLDRCYQTALSFVFLNLRIWWFIRRPNHHGVLVMIWFQDQVLLVRNSYQPCWSAPGGAIEASESSIEAAIRECKEEIKLDINQTELVFIRDIEYNFRSRADKVSLFEWHPKDRPFIKIDNREIIEARWFSPSSTHTLNLITHLSSYIKDTRFMKN